MTGKSLTFAGDGVGLAGCSQTVAQQQMANEANPPAVERRPCRRAAAPSRASPALPDDRTPLEEPKGPIDPKSAEAAGQVVQHYGALIEQGRWAEACEALVQRRRRKNFDRNWRDDSEVHMEIGKPGDMEGAAGSSYVTVPVIFYGKPSRRIISPCRRRDPAPGK